MGSPDVPKAAIFIPSAHRFRTEDGMELRSIERPRKQRIVVMTVALILAAVAVAGTIRAFRADHRPADETPAVVARIRVAHAPSAIAADRDAIWVLSAATLSRIDPQTDQVEVVGALRIAPPDELSGFAVTRDAVWIAVFGNFNANGTVSGG